MDAKVEWAEEETLLMERLASASLSYCLSPQEMDSDRPKSQRLRQEYLMPMPAMDEFWPASSDALQESLSHGNDEKIERFDRSIEEDCCCSCSEEEECISSPRASYAPFWTMPLRDDISYREIFSKTAEPATSLPFSTTPIGNVPIGSGIRRKSLSDHAQFSLTEDLSESRFFRGRLRALSQYELGTQFELQEPKLTSTLGSPPASRSRSLSDTKVMLPSLPIKPQPSQTTPSNKYKGPLYIVEFKAGRSELFYVSPQDLNVSSQNPVKEGSHALMKGVSLKGHSSPLSLGQWVIVEADRGEDLGKITGLVSLPWVQAQMSLMNLLSKEEGAPDGLILESVDKCRKLAMTEGCSFLYASRKGQIVTQQSIISYDPYFLSCKELLPKRLYRLASSADMASIPTKSQEEELAVLRSSSRLLTFGADQGGLLPMSILDAEYQWDKNKLTFYYASKERIDFRELVKEFFRIYKTRIWMCASDRKSKGRICYPLG